MRSPSFNFAMRSERAKLPTLSCGTPEPTARWTMATPSVSPERAAQCRMNPAPVYFSPHSLVVGARERGGLTCEYFRGQFKAQLVVCERFERDRVIGDARMGCAYWQREPGADDE